MNTPSERFDCPIPSLNLAYGQICYSFIFLISNTAFASSHVVCCSALRALLKDFDVQFDLKVIPALIHFLFSWLGHETNNEKCIGPYYHKIHTHTGTHTERKELIDVSRVYVCTQFGMNILAWRRAFTQHPCGTFGHNCLSPQTQLRWNGFPLYFRKNQGMCTLMVVTMQERLTWLNNHWCHRPPHCSVIFSTSHSFYSWSHKSSAFLFHFFPIPDCHEYLIPLCPSLAFFLYIPLIYYWGDWNSSALHAGHTWGIIFVPSSYSPYAMPVPSLIVIGEPEELMVV